jgi:hypothetical protein
MGRNQLPAVFGVMRSGGAVVCVKKLQDMDSTHAIFFSQCVIGLWHSATTRA